MYYITVRGGTAKLFLDQQDLDAYLTFLAESKAKHGFKLYAYALQPDQIFLCLELGDGVSLPDIMQASSTRYARYHGKRYGRQGPLYQGRYRVVVVEKAQNLLPLIRYIHVQDRPLATSESDYLRQLGRELTPSLVDAESVLAYAHGQSAASPEALILAASPEEQAHWRALLRHPYVGSPEFLARLKPLTRRHPRRGWRRFLAASVMVGVAQAATMTAMMVKWTPSAPLIVAPQVPAVLVSPPAPVGQMAALMPAHPASALPGTSWEIRLMPADASGVVQQDRLTFDGSTVSSLLLAKATSHYIVTPQPDGVFVWETMQIGPDGTVVCWQGEWNGQTMRGIVTRQTPGSAAVNLSFIGMSVSDHGPQSPGAKEL